MNVSNDLLHAPKTIYPNNSKESERSCCIFSLTARQLKLIIGIIAISVTVATIVVFSGVPLLVGALSALATITLLSVIILFDNYKKNKINKSISHPFITENDSFGQRVWYANEDGDPVQNNDMNNSDDPPMQPFADLVPISNP